MKFNVLGKGVIPGIRRLAPVRNVELSKQNVARLLNFSQFKVYAADGRGLVTKRNIDMIFAAIEEVKTPTVEPVVETPVVVNEPVVIEEPVKEIFEEEIIVEPTEDFVDVIEETVEESTEETADEAAEIVEESVEDEPKQNNNNKKKNRNRR